MKSYFTPEHAALLREPGKEIENGLSEHPHEPINIDKAKQQHNIYVKTLQQIGFFTKVLPADPQQPDGCFTEDTYLILPEVVIRLNPGAPSRANEYKGLEQHIPHDRVHVELPIELKIDGGDILVVNKRVYIGLSSRTLPQSIEKVREILKEYDYEVIAFKVPHGLHLKSGLTAINENVFIMQKSFEKPFLELHENLHESKEYFIVPENENFAANILPLNGHILIPPNCPETKNFICKHITHENIHEVDTSEMRKVDGALTCLSIPYRAM